MTSMAVTARICASAPEAAFLVASFIVVSLDLFPKNLGIQAVGMSHRRPRRLDGSLIFYAEHPTTSIRFDRVPTQRISTEQGSNSNAATIGKHRGELKFLKPLRRANSGGELIEQPVRGATPKTG